MASGAAGTYVLRSALAFAAFMVFSLAATRASRMAERDVVARPLLAPLPIAPSDALRGKASLLRRQMLLQALPLVALLAAPGSIAQHAEIAWRVAAVIAALAVSAGALVAVAFLTGGLGSQKRGPVGVTALENILVLLPLVRVATAQSPWDALVSLGCVALLAREAERAAHGCVRWLDDADPFERETAVWRALLVLTGFQAVQSLALQLLALSPLAASTSMAIAYAMSALALVAMTAYERRGLASIRVRPSHAGWLAAGAGAGLAAGVCATGYARLLARLGVELPTPAAGAGAWALAGAVVVAAPVAEELFFRGWLQDVIGEEYAARGRWFAVGVTAFVFAAIHPAVSFAPVLVLGLATGLLFRASRGIGPGILAHATYNGIVVAMAWTG